MEKVSPDKVGERIRAVRGKQTQTEFANVLGVKKQNYISRYERGRIPSPDLLVRIAEVGRVTTDWLLTGQRGGARGAALAQKSKPIKKKQPEKVAAKPKSKAKTKIASKPKAKKKAAAKPARKVKARAGK
ncbi:MAG: helix-turn-helix domain-containing protein [Nitrospiria bacterium]